MWVCRFISSSIGKKLLMAVTGLGFILFVIMHLAGNLTVYGGPDYFDAYVHNLHRLGPLITLFELGLLFFAAVHVGTGLLLFFQNLAARPERYEVKKGAGGQTISSRTMPYSGIIILGFVAVHLLNFHFIGDDPRPMSDIVASVFKVPAYAGFYVAAMVVLGFHVRQGLWSAFQSLGANHPAYMPAVQAISVVFAIALAAGFAAIPLYVMYTG